MPKALLSREQWGHVHATAVALQSIQEAAKAHGVSIQAAYKRARREKWLVGRPATVEANRAERVERAEAAGVLVASRRQAAPVTAADAIDAEINQNGRKTRAMLSQALYHAAGQARKTKHPLAKARHIRDVASAAATVHPDQFGSAGGATGGQHEALGRVQIALVQVFGDRSSCPMLGEEIASVIKQPAQAIPIEDTGKSP
jgi:hypothetical protein